MISEKLKYNKYAFLLIRLTSVFVAIVLIFAMAGCTMFDNQQESSLPQNVDTSDTINNDTVTETTNSSIDETTESGGSIVDWLQSNDLLYDHDEYINRQKDESNMIDIANWAVFASHNEDIYNEILDHSIDNNVSCYIDKEKESQLAVEKLAIDGDYYQYGNDARVNNKEPYYAAGNMRGVTITFKPSINNGVTSYKLEDGVINMFKGDGEVKLKDCELLFEYIKSNSGYGSDWDGIIELGSRTYQNSDYTIFIHFYEKASDTVGSIKVYGQFNGVKLKMIDNTVRIASK